MLIYFRVFVEWLETGTCWNLENYGFSICIGSTTYWIGWNDYVVTIIGYIMETTSSIDIIGSTWMLSTT
jgi:hypothetical protein